MFNNNFCSESFCVTVITFTVNICGFWSCCNMCDCGGRGCQIGMNLLVTEARLEAELIYGLYAINRNMNMAFWCSLQPAALSFLVFQNI